MCLFLDFESHGTGNKPATGWGQHRLHDYIESWLGHNRAHSSLKLTTRSHMFQVVSLQIIVVHAKSLISKDILWKQHDDLVKTKPLALFSIDESGKKKTQLFGFFSSIIL